ncbi:MAG: hypothetical protein BAA04_12810 [Firmicutes bacterium ZCTH02-B6]|nr:MAG: hypothetical protein BAA04_12810 [Firmicutes bacterium ZCTH02-B6]
MTGFHVVLGATGGAGGAVVRELVARGFPTRAVGRKDVQFPGGVDYVRGDATDRSTLARVCKGAAVVYHCVNVPYVQWERTLPQLAREILAACAEAGARLVVVDNVYMYGPAEGPITEETPRRPVGPKGRLRAQLEEFFLNAHRERKADVCIARASDFYGPPSPGSMGNNVAAQLVFQPAIAGKRAAWLGSLDVPHTLAYLPDVGRNLVTLAENARAFGEVWHLPAAEPITGREFIRLVFAALGRPPRIGMPVRRWMLALAGFFSRDLREVGEVLYQFERSFIVDATKFQRTFGGYVTPHEQAIRETVAAWTGGQN